MAAPKHFLDLDRLDGGTLRAMIERDKNTALEVAKKEGLGQGSK